jgi:hypothetical protein
MDKRKRDNDNVCPDSVEVEVVRWKNRPFLRIVESEDFDPEDPHKSPEVERFFIQSLQEGHLRYFHGYAVTLQEAKDKCEVIARDFEKFLNEWHNAKSLQKGN